jgi:hypothetical protein
MSDTNSHINIEEVLEQELNEFLIKNLNILLPVINQRCNPPFSIEELLKVLNIKIDKVKRCSYVFKRGIRANQRCNNICIDGKDICSKCSKILKNRLYGSIELRELKENEYIDEDGIMYRKTEDDHLEVINKNQVDEKKMKKLKNYGIKF